MNQELIESIRLLCKERGLEPQTIFTAIEEALVAAYKREFNAKSTDNVHATFDPDTGEMSIYLEKVVVEDLEDPNEEISLTEAQALDPDFEVGDVLQYELQPEQFGRLAAQAAKSAISQALITAERDLIHEEFSSRVGELASGVVQRKDRREVVVDIGRAEAVLTSREQSPLDDYSFNERMMFYIKRVDDKRGRPVVYVSRSHPDLVRKLFEQEVPEIASGIVEIVNCVREAGSRTKISVATRDENVDPLGACVGQRGMRVQNVLNELRGEKIDIIEWDPDETIYIRNALKPASASRIQLTETEDSKQAEVVVPDNQLSLAIGKNGQNARLAARLTGWKIDIKSESQVRESLEEAFMARFDEAAEGLTEEAVEDTSDSATEETEA
jgi:N utilization substance protein A